MAQTAWSGLLTGSSSPLLAAGDLVAFVDISDPTQALSGSLVKATLTQYFAAIPVPIVVTSASANALAVGRLGATTPAFQVDASTGTSVTGLKVKSAAAAAGVALSVISSGTNESVTFDAKGSGTISLATVSTGAVIAGADVYRTGAAGTNRLIELQTAGVRRWLFNCNATAESGSNAGSDFELLARTDAGGPLFNALLITRSTGVATFSGTQTNVTAIKTADPSGLTAKLWKLGQVHVTSPTAPNRTISVEVDGTVLYIAAKTTND